MGGGGMGWDFRQREQPLRGLERAACAMEDGGRDELVRESAQVRRRAGSLHVS